jgi:CRP-like cAMP-binding protein
MSLKFVEVEKKRYLLDESKPLKDIYIVTSGLFGMSYKDRHQTVFTSFRVAGDVIIYDKYFYSDVQTHASILALEKSTVYSLQYQTCKQICLDFPDFNFHIRTFLQKNVDLIEDRLKITQTPLIRTRYGRFIKIYADIFPRIPTKYLASYLNASVKSIQMIKKEMSIRRNSIPPVL